jgi:hypothetical protein
MPPTGALALLILSLLGGAARAAFIQSISPSQGSLAGGTVRGCRGASPCATGPAACLRPALSGQHGLAAPREAARPTPATPASAKEPGCPLPQVLTIAGSGFSAAGGNVVYIGNSTCRVMAHMTSDTTVRGGAIRYGAVPSRRGRGA